MFVSLNIPAMVSKARLLADKRGSNFYNDTEIESLLKDAFDMLFMKITDLDENYFLKSSDLLDAQNGDIALPSDMYQLRLVERVSGGYSFPIYQKTLAEVSGISSPYYEWTGEAVPFGFVLFEDKLTLYPRESANGFKFRLSYSRDPLALGSEKLQTGWVNALTYKTAYTISGAEDNPKVFLADLAKEWQNQVMSFASNRNKGPVLIQDLERHGAHHGGLWI